MKIAYYDETNGKLLGWYDDKIHKDIPTPNTEVSDENWKQAISINANFIDRDGVLSKKDFRTLEQLKASKLKELEASYSNSIQQNIGYLDTTFQADKASQDLIASNLSVGSVPDGFYWQDINNEKVPMSYEDLQGLASAIQTRGLVSFGKLQELKALVKEATTVEELEEILWEE